MSTTKIVLLYCCFCVPVHGTTMMARNIIPFYSNVRNRNVLIYFGPERFSITRKKSFFREDKRKKRKKRKRKKRKRKKTKPKKTKPKKTKTSTHVIIRNRTQKKNSSYVRVRLYESTRYARNTQKNRIHTQHTRNGRHHPHFSEKKKKKEKKGGSSGAVGTSIHR